MAEAKQKAEVTQVTMKDGRVVGFTGKRKVIKETLIDESKIELDEANGIIQIGTGAISTRMDFVNGETRTYPMALSLVPKFAGHGSEQKRGDELASPASDPLSAEDMVIACDDLDAELRIGKWGRARAEGGGGVSGAHEVVLAIIEATTPARASTGKPPMTVAEVKEFLQKKLDADKDLSRRALYDSFRRGAATGPIIERLEKAKKATAPKVNTDEMLEEVS